jgi:hypothetical protein
VSRDYDVIIIWNDLGLGIRCFMITIIIGETLGSIEFYDTTTSGVAVFF